MKSFFANMNLARGIILLSLIGSAVLAWRGTQLQAAEDELQTALRIDVPKAVQEIQKNSGLHTKLTRDKDGDEFIRLDSPESYIRKIATRRETEIGELNLNPSQRSLLKGVTDFVYRIQPDDPKRVYMRARIGNFLYYLEEQSRRIKVTDVKLSLVNSRIKPHEIPADEWTFEAEITSRQKEEAGG